MTNIKNSSGQRGVALLFALGILSLILVMGVAFLGNALISQKIAVNSQESSSAKLLARSAVDRALAHLTMFQLIQVRNNGDFYASDASSVFSRMSTGAFDNATVLTTRRDQIYTGVSPRLSISRGQEGNKKWYDGSKSYAEWIYLHEDGKFSDGQGTGEKIVGRFAYQVLPQSSNSRLSLFAVTAGASRRAGKDLDTTATARIPQKHRLGVDIDELVIPGTPNKIFSKYWNFNSGDDLCDPIHEFDNFVNLLSGTKSDANYFYDDNAVTESRKRWLEHIFAEGRGRVAREAFWGGGNNWYPRFNLGEFKHYWNADSKSRVTVKNTDNTWYQRFLDLPAPPADAAAETTEINKIKNSDDVVELLTGGISTTDRNPALLGRYTDGNLYDGQYPVLGLPFLRLIGSSSEKGGFESVVNLRKQIAANLNDYCDADYIPTSDVKAVEWLNAVTGAGTVPLYTGNEQTPYINEVGFGFKVGNSKFTTNGSEYKFSTEIESEVLVELIKVYQSLAKNQAGTALTAADLSFQGKVNDLALTLKLELKGKVTFYQTKDGVESKIGETTDFTLNDVEHTATLIDSSNRCTLEIDKGGFSGDGPYWVKSVPLQFSDAVGGKVKNVEIDLTEKLKSAYSFDGATPSRVAVELVNVKVGLTKVEFNFGNLVLLAPDWASDSTPPVGIDFAAMENKAGTKHLCEPASAVTLCDGTEANFNNLLGAGYFSIAYFGSMEARDPRQNLNARFDLSTNNDNCTNDWDVVALPSLTFVAGAVQSLSTTSSLKWDDLTTRITGGKVNSVSNPSKTDVTDGVSANPLSRIDKETATDPAWKGTADNEHISTAVIRNKPMRSLWELGFIHRGIPFQTINLQKAGGIDGSETLSETAHALANFKKWSNMGASETGTLYQYGDAGILDQVKLTDFTKSYGKIDFSALQNQPANWVDGGDGFGTLRKQLLQGLFENVKSHSSSAFVEKTSDADKAPGFDAAEEKPLPFTVDVDNFFTKAPVTVLRSNIFGKNEEIETKIDGLTTDAAREELIGKTINLVEGRGASLPNVFKVVVVAQAIRDWEGSVSRLDSANALKSVTAAKGKFDAEIKADWNDSVYYDEIIGECRMLVTVEKLHYMDGDVPRARLRVKQIEYLD
ncbi:MAG: hypothetical protein E7048_03220 [Lentisphaerae bacterium]|nr:hypothetical protein [Lentisphaerota bacterium]